MQITQVKYAVQCIMHVCTQNTINFIYTIAIPFISFSFPYIYQSSRMSYHQKIDVICYLKAEVAGN